MISWTCKSTWNTASVNTLWCLLGCSIGDLGTIFYFQNIEHSWTTLQIMTLAIMNGLLTSIALETFIMFKQLGVLKDAFKIAIGMSFISMVAHGARNEYNGCTVNRRCKTYMVGYTIYVASRIYYAASL